MVDIEVPVVADGEDVPVPVPVEEDTVEYELFTVVEEDDESVFEFVPELITLELG